MTRYVAWYGEERLGTFDTLTEAKACIKAHTAYKKSWFTKKGDPTSANPNQKLRFRIYDTKGFGWYL